MARGAGELEGRPEIERSVRRLDFKLALAARRINDGPDMAGGILIDLHAALTGQRLVQPFVESVDSRRGFFRGANHDRP
jgi:hypothetical protein